MSPAPGPLLLALETATSALSVALVRGADGEPIAERDEAGGEVHSRRLLPAVEALLAEARVGLAQVDALAVSIGPGSFTGLRIGLATAKGLAFGSGRPLVAVPTLAALAAAAPADAGPVAALLDARRGELYAGLYRARDGAWQAEGPEGVFTPEELDARLPADCAFALGEGAEETAAALLARRAGARVVPAAASAARVGRLGAHALARGGGAPAEELVPRYLRRAEAEVRRTGERLERIDAPPRVT